MIDKGDEINIIRIFFGGYKASINPLNKTTGNQCGKIMYESLIVCQIFVSSGYLQEIYLQRKY